MKPGLIVGKTGQLSWTVGPQHVVHLGSDEPSGGVVVFSTPNMILLMERAARAAIEPFLEPGEESVGVSVSVEHVAGTPIAAKVFGDATVSRVEGKLIDFEIKVRDEHEVLGQGTHRRAIVALDKIRQRLIEKLPKLSFGMVLPMQISANSGNLPDLKTIKTGTKGAVLYATLDRPNQLNAINAQMTSDWEHLIAWLAGHADQIRVMIVSGAGEAFSTGSDIKELSNRSIDEATAISHRQARMFLALESLPQVVIAAVNGHALGGGCVMAYSCDFRVAASNATFGMPEIMLGWPPGYGIAQLTSLIGKARALDLCLTGRTLKASQAAELGLVHSVVPRAQVLSSATSLAEELLAMPSSVLSETKRLIHANQGELPKITHLADTAAYIRCLQQHDAKEGIAAFLEKRKPNFH